MSSLQILQHRTLSKGSSPYLHGSKDQSQRLFPQHFLILVMHLEPTIESNVGKKYTIHMQYNTKFSITDKPRFIAIHDVNCTEEDLPSPTPSDLVAFSEVVLEFADSLVAKSLMSDLNHAKQLLQLQRLTGQRWGEQLLLQRDLPGARLIGHLVLSDARFMLIVDSKSGMFRIVLLRGDHTAAVCFDLPPEALQESLVRNKSVTKTSRPAWFVDIDETRIHITRQESGIDPLSVFSKRYKHSFMLELGEEEE